MRGDACLGALDYLKVPVVAEQHAHKRILRHQGVYPRGDALILGQVAHGLAEAGAVVVVDLNYPLLQLLGVVHGGVDGKVSALGVAADAHLTFKTPGRAHEIARRVRLCGDGVEAAHVEVLLPGDDVVVGTAEGDKARLVRQNDGHGGKLLLRRGVHVVDIVAQLQFLESRSLQHLLEHGDRTGGQQHAPAHVLLAELVEIALRGLLNATLALGGYYAREVQGDDLAHEEVIHLVEG